MDKRGLKYAIDYLNSFYPWKGVPEEVKARAGCTCMSDTLGRKLRDNTNREDDTENNPAGPFMGRVVVWYVMAEDGKNKIAFYQGNPSFKAPERKKKQREDTAGVNPIYAQPAPAVYFYALNGQDHVYSPYYVSMDDIIPKLESLDDKRIYTGSHEKPVLFIRP